MNTKNINPLKELRNIREKMSVRYWKNTELLKKEMVEIRKKYNLKSNLDKSKNKKAV